MSKSANFMKKINKKNSNIIKLNTFIKDDLYKFRNCKILEFGVDKGFSTNFFLKYCQKRNGKLYSVDIKNYKWLFKNKRWQFLQSFDYEKKKVDKMVKGKVDVIFLDTEHTPQHLKKLIYLYWNKLKKNGMFIIDDISWLPYLKNEYRNSEWIENNNRNSFNKILEIYLANKESLNLQFSFSFSGMAKIKKLSNIKLAQPKKIKIRNLNIKNFLRSFRS